MDKKDWAQARAAERMRKPKHLFEELTGDALDSHMIAMHGWDMPMVANRGTRSPRVPEYAGHWHQNAHHVSTAVSTES